MTEYYDSPIWDKPPWMCPSPNIGLSLAVKNNDYDAFIKQFGFGIRIMGKGIDLEHIWIYCEGQCPKGCDKKFKLNLGKSITKKSFEKLYKHCSKYPEHCISTKFIGVTKHE